MAGQAAQGSGRLGEAAKVRADADGLLGKMIMKSVYWVEKDCQTEGGYLLLSH
ncbi:hypothetical protein [Desulfobulbus propionicus]|jgi:hypothetical protein|uniref:hypothetical protein n=1 Tax=Desulfobulbus propionicus TaxID=894 RepID=UPI00146DB7EF|nr:hypothetical protein [Desulfobulbus propionicus]